jgi:hypothetical protein
LRVNLGARGVLCCATDAKARGPLRPALPVLTPPRPCSRWRPATASTSSTSVVWRQQMMLQHKNEGRGVRDLREQRHATCHARGWLRHASRLLKAVPMGLACMFAQCKGSALYRSTELAPRGMSQAGTGPQARTCGLISAHRDG